MSTEQQLNAMRTLQDFIRPRINWSFPLQTRVHPLHSFKRLNSNVFVKRDDETGFGIGGSKFRKYASLIPFLKDNNLKLKQITLHIDYLNIFSFLINRYKHFIQKKINFIN